MPQAAAGVLTVAAEAERVARIARWNGGSIAVVAGVASLQALATGAFLALPSAIVAFIAGLRENAVGRRLRARTIDRAVARGALVRAELALLVAILAWSVLRLATAQPAAEVAALPVVERELLLGMVGGDRALLEQLYALALRITYGALIVVALVYQGGMAWWYDRRLGDAA